jgi:cation:H+ antiporter
VLEHLTITNSVNLASVTGLGKTKIGFILVAFSTSLPELVVVIFSIMKPQTVGISVGNVLGSNIVNICLILGVSFLVMATKYPESAGFFTRMTGNEVGNLNFGLFVASIVPLILLYVGYASQIAGFLLVVLFVYNMYDLAKKREVVEEISDVAEKKELKKYAIKAFLGIVGVVVCAYFIVESASFLALSVGIPPIVVGATVVAFGTSIPENITLILGLNFLLSPFNVDISAFSKLAIFSLISNVVLGYILQNTKVSTREGILLIALYIIFVAISLSP